MFAFAPFIFVLLSIITTAGANTEKIIFLAPGSISIPDIHPGLDDLCLDTISPTQNVLHTQLPVRFPTEEEPRGTQHWYLLEGLKEGRRYEVRVCWVATQPTQFWLDVHTVSEVFETPALIAPLAEYAETRQGETCAARALKRQPGQGTGQVSTLFLRIHSAADYYTSNQTLMKHPPAVDVDIILDPYLLNIFPRSLTPTAAYIAVLTAGGWFLSGVVYRWLRQIASEGADRPHND